MPTPAVSGTTVAVTPVSVVVPSLNRVTLKLTVSPASQSPLPPAPPVEQVSLTSACEPYVACGPQAAAGKVKFSVTALMLPTSAPAESTTKNFQVPAAFLPLNTESGWSGRKVPVNGAAPDETGVAAESSKTVP